MALDALRRAGGALVMLAFGLAAVARAAEPSPKPPSFSTIEQAVRHYLGSLPDMRSGDILAKPEVEGALRQVEKAGWKFANRDEILRRVHDEQDFVVQVLRAGNGRRFMRGVATVRLGYDRLDRLADLPHGRQTVQDLIRNPEGYKMIEYLSTQSGGRETGRMLSKGANFNQPTGRIYTVDMLVGELRKLYSTPTAPPAGKR